VRRLLLGAVVAIALVTSTLAAAHPSTKPSWAAAANAICGKGNARVRRLPNGTSPLVLASNFHAIAGIVSEENAKLSVIARPLKERRRIEAFLSASRGLVLLYRQAATAEERRNRAATLRVLAKIDKLGSQYNVIARTLGARVCAEAS
jgi:hypothetical protein